MRSSIEKHCHKYELNALPKITLFFFFFAGVRMWVGHPKIALDYRGEGEGRSKKGLHNFLMVPYKALKVKLSSQV